MRQDTSKASIKQTERFAWWQEFLDRVGGVLRVRVVRPAKTLEKTLEWMKRQVSGTIAALRDGMGVGRFDRYLRDLICDGRDRRRLQHEFMIEQLAC